MEPFRLDRQAKAFLAVLVIVAPESYPRFESPHWVNIVGLIVSNASVMAGTLAFLLAYRDEAEQELKRLATTDGLTGEQVIDRLEAIVRERMQTNRPGRSRAAGPM